MNIIFLGAPGSGKGTISHQICSEKNFRHISTGDLIRNELKKNSKFTSKLNLYLKKGDLVPDSLTNQILQEHLSSIDKMDWGLIFDGYPRNIQQAIYLDNICKIDYAIYLDVDFELLIKRISGRRICSKCNNSYNIYFHKPKLENYCDFDNSKLIQRDDDAKEIAMNRLDIFSDSLEILLDYYRKQNKLIEIKILETSTSKEIISKITANF